MCFLQVKCLYTLILWFFAKGVLISGGKRGRQNGFCHYDSDLDNKSLAKQFSVSCESVLSRRKNVVFNILFSKYGRL